MFVGITALAITSHVHFTDTDNAHLIGFPAGATQQTVIAQLGSAVFGAARSASICCRAHGRDSGCSRRTRRSTASRSWPRSWARTAICPGNSRAAATGLVFSNGCRPAVGLLACLLIWSFNASTTRLIQLYHHRCVRVVHAVAGWHGRALAPQPEDRARPAERRAIHRRRLINMTGTVATALVLLSIVLIPKFTHGAWIVVIAMPLVSC